MVASKAKRTRTSGENETLISETKCSNYHRKSVCCWKIILIIARVPAVDCVFRFPQESQPVNNVWIACRLGRCLTCNHMYIYTHCLSISVGRIKAQRKGGSRKIIDKETRAVSYLYPDRCIMFTANSVPLTFPVVFVGTSH